MRHATVYRKSLLVEGRDDTFRVFIHELLVFGARLEAIRSEFGARMGLGGSAFTCLMGIALLEHQQGVGIKAVARHLHLSPAYVTLEVTKLVEKGLIIKKIDLKDRRRVLLTLSEQAHNSLVALAPVQAQVNDRLFSCLSARDFRRLCRLLPRLVDASELALAFLS